MFDSNDMPAKIILKSSFYSQWNYIFISFKLIEIDVTVLFLWKNDFVKNEKYYSVLFEVKRKIQSDEIFLTKWKYVASIGIEDYLRKHKSHDTKLKNLNYKVTM